MDDLFVGALTRRRSRIADRVYSIRAESKALGNLRRQVLIQEKLDQVDLVRRCKLALEADSLFDCFDGHVVQARDRLNVVSSVDEGHDLCGWNARPGNAWFAELNLRIELNVRFRPPADGNTVLIEDIAQCILNCRREDFLASKIRGCQLVANLRRGLVKNIHAICLKMHACERAWKL